MNDRRRVIIIGNDIGMAASIRRVLPSISVAIVAAIDASTHIPQDRPCADISSFERDWEHRKIEDKFLFDETPISAVPTGRTGKQHNLILGFNKKSKKAKLNF